MANRTLVTGFGPFQGVPINPSEELACRSDRRHEVLEVSYEVVDAFVLGLEADSFDLWLMLGVAARRKAPALELLARNSRQGQDVRGRAASGPIEAGSPLLVESTLWEPELASELLTANRELRASMDAGVYLCNYLAYRGLRRFPNKRIGFLHVVMPDARSIDGQARLVQQVLLAAEA